MESKEGDVTMASMTTATINLPTDDFAVSVPSVIAAYLVERPAPYHVDPMLTRRSLILITGPFDGMRFIPPIA